MIMIYLYLFYYFDHFCNIHNQDKILQNLHESFLLIHIIVRKTHMYIAVFYRLVQSIYDIHSVLNDVSGKIIVSNELHFLVKFFEYQYVCMA